MNALTIADLFAGVGGLSLGFEQNDFDLVFASDFDPAASNTFRANHPSVPFQEKPIQELDLEQIRSTHMPLGLDVLVGGVPCQAFSMSGNRIRKPLQGLLDERVFLFRFFLEAVKTWNPRVVVIENVKGILSMLNGAVVAEIVASLESLGYEVSFKVLNAADFGAPQLRERTIFLANRIGCENLFPTATASSSTYTTLRQALQDLPSLNHEPRVLTGAALERVKLLKPGENWRHLPASMQTKSIHSGAYGRLSWDKPARTLTTRFDTPSVGYVTHPSEDRCLTVREGARIQGFPDDFVFLGSRMAQYRQVGNAVSPYLSRALAKRIKQMLNESE